MIIISYLSPQQEKNLAHILKINKGALGWVLSDLKGINPSYCMHKIMMEENSKPIASPQCRMNPTMKGVIIK